jgi:hypothetical protein
MKKFAILALAALMVVAITVPASALENEFGGYFDTRFQTKNNFDGFDQGSTLTDPAAAGVDFDDHNQNVMQRTRLYYTAKINDNLKLVNKFEMDATWGTSTGSRAGGAATNKGYGVVGADGANIEIKNTYVDFNTGPVNWTIGTQGYNLWRGYYIADDGSGVIARWKILDNFILAGSWLKVYEGGVGQNNADVDSYTVTGAFWFNENISIKPSINYAHTGDLGPGAGAASSSAAIVAAAAAGVLQDSDTYNYGFDFDMNYDNWGLWVTAVMQDGTVNTLLGDLDKKGWMVGAGGNVMLGMFDIYAEGAYSTGDDDPTDSDLDTFSAPYGSHVWSELLADGDLWMQSLSPAGRPDINDTYDQMGNIWYVGGGVKVSPMDKLTINPSIWYASLAEDNQTGDKALGTEVDLKITYQLIEGLNVDLIGAYLFADDAFSNYTDDNKDDAYEAGMRISLSF